MKKNRTNQKGGNKMRYKINTTDSYGLTAEASRAIAMGLPSDAPRSINGYIMTYGADGTTKPAQCVNCRSGRCEAHIRAKYDLAICPVVIAGLVTDRP